MAMTIRVDIVSAEESLFSGDAAMVFASAQLGEVGIAPRHTAFISRLKPGDVRIQDESGKQQTFYVSGGIIEVQPTIVTILADTAIRAKDIDEAAAIEAKRRAEEALANSKSKFELTTAQVQLVEALAKLQTLEKYRGHQV